MSRGFDRKVQQKTRQKTQQERAEAQTQLGYQYYRQGKISKARDCFAQALSLRPDHPEAHLNMGVVLTEQGKIDQSIEHFQAALKLNPNYGAAHSNLGVILLKQERLDEAIDCFQKAIDTGIQHADIYYNYGVALAGLMRLDEAIEFYQRSIELQPQHVDAHFNLSQALLTQGKFARGWQEYEWRWQRQMAEPRNFSQPLWDGSPLSGRTLLIHAEQGFGDTIQFIRYVNLITFDRLMFDRIIVECPPTLIRLLETLDRTVQLIATGDPIPPFDIHAPLLSLPKILNTTLESIPAQVPYLRSPSASLPAILDLDRINIGLKIGIVWASGQLSDHPDSIRMYKSKSCSLKLLAESLKSESIALYSLQVGKDALQFRSQTQIPIVDLSPQIHDFADTAALISNLDLIITVDTSIGHLAGALAKPVWVLLPFAADWRWLAKRQDCPWYPTMRLFRQSFPGDWLSVFEQIRHAISTEFQP